MCLSRVMQAASLTYRDGLFDQNDIVAALETGKHLTGTYAAIMPGGVFKGSKRGIPGEDEPARPLYRLIPEASPI